ncbi:MAG: response regulator transcription factor [Rhodospirillaceae bacterium]
MSEIESSSGSRDGILIVEDDRLAREALQSFLTDEGFNVQTAGNGDEMRSCLNSAIPSVVLMDLRLPGEDGFELTRYLRDSFDLGIIILTTKTELVDRVVGLEIGADDYVTKPYQPRELLARIRSLLRRLETNAAIESSATHSTKFTDVPVGIFQFAGCALDGERRKLNGPNGELVDLTTGEIKLLSVLVQNPYVAMSRADLMQAIYHREWNPLDRSIDVLVTKVRRKLEKLTGDVSLIRSVRGIGYELAVAVEKQ